MQCHEDLEFKLAPWKGSQAASSVLENSLHLVNIQTVYIQNSQLLLTVGQGRVIAGCAEQGSF